jgi:isocitrate dehydrogenase kinase/phosphatase
LEKATLAILFSYTRAYFRVDAPATYALVQWLRQLMPDKRIADLYNAIGLPPHAKTEFYRDFVSHLEKFARSLRRGGRRPRHGHARLHACRATTSFLN